MSDCDGHGGGRQSLAKRWPVLGPCFGVAVGSMAAAYALVKGDGVAATVSVALRFAWPWRGCTTTTCGNEPRPALLELAAVPVLPHMLETVGRLH